MSIAFLNRTSQVGKRVRYVGLVSVVVVTGLLGAAALFIGKPRVSPQAIATSVTRAPELLERAWQLPVAATFNRELVWQSNISRCGPASVANAYRSGGYGKHRGQVACRHGPVLDRFLYPRANLGRIGRCRTSQSAT